MSVQSEQGGVSRSAPSLVGQSAAPQNARTLHSWRPSRRLTLLDSILINVLTRKGEGKRGRSRDLNAIAKESSTAAQYCVTCLSRLGDDTPASPSSSRVSSSPAARQCGLGVQFSALEGPPWDSIRPGTGSGAGKTRLRALCALPPSPRCALTRSGRTAEAQLRNTNATHCSSASAPHSQRLLAQGTVIIQQ